MEEIVIRKQIIIMRLCYTMYTVTKVERPKKEITEMIFSICQFVEQSRMNVLFNVEYRSIPQQFRAQMIRT